MELVLISCFGYLTFIYTGSPIEQQGLIFERPIWEQMEVKGLVQGPRVGQRWRQVWVLHHFFISVRSVEPVMDANICPSH